MNCEYLILDTLINFNKKSKTVMSRLASVKTERKTIFKMQFTTNRSVRVSYCARLDVKKEIHCITDN